MAKKKKSASAKKNRSRKNNNGASDAKKSVPLEEVLGQAESAMEMSDVDTALQLFSYAAGVLRSRLHAPVADIGHNTSLHDNDRDKKTLSTVLGKMGELKASTGDLEGARSDFLDAVEQLEPAPANEASSAGDGKASAAEGECDVGVAQNSESRAGLHLYLGQLSSGTEALASFRVGVSELERAVRVLERINALDDRVNDVAMDGCDETGTVNLKRFLVETRRQLCAAHCSIAELYLTDLCEEPDAESSCEAALTSALALDEVSSADTLTADENDENRIGPPPPDALQTMANFRLSQSRLPEALECILKAYGRMKVGCEAMSALVGLGNDDGGKRDVELESKSRELVDVEAASTLPEYNFRCQTAKIMLECASLLESDDSNAKDRINQCAESAIQVLGSLLAQNDEVIEVWYLLGCAFMACTPPNQESAHYYWENSLTMLTKVKKGLEESMGDYDDDGCNENELELIECQIIDVKKKLGEYDEDEEMEDS
mmetsp:Transcript_8375/g.18104  ORF Transcript_8375/g.18104 Transcript_8375/m.18104 type:complete len:490 (-) Transcript_8375:80-1549(-)|eukprot:CAMPEP_0172555398 /NCGR_PEP_ID=MMETSP1067-20121228/58395_1 /TAXON_ID=265564 ORGANISM="Thalassiosira punctigera, Strain Tpunct2005C2" /NCGR_SAMPLE_ID=MMETSP1067 /ASSEMBLY_ACC=CAM_ASM_000444 /LENGTH=489 /DNA_ID=CAMNT_0013343915 /DNA_START=118 /DNA_END=1587 /DNA_ORIENTATION=-